MDGDNIMTNGFYKYNGTSLFFGKKVINASYTLNADEHESYTYPKDGWYYFISKEKALNFYGIEEIDNGTYVPFIRKVTQAQLRKWLLVNKQVKVEDIINLINQNIPDSTERELALIDFEFADVIHLDNPLVLMIGTALGMTEAKIEQAFIEASSL
jgi:hypothetical protein